MALENLLAEPLALQSYAKEQEVADFGTLPRVQAFIDSIDLTV